MSLSTTNAGPPTQPVKLVQMGHPNFFRKRQRRLRRKIINNQIKKYNTPVGTHSMIVAKVFPKSSSKYNKILTKNQRHTLEDIAMTMRALARHESQKQELLSLIQPTKERLENMKSKLRTISKIQDANKFGTRRRGGRKPIISNDINLRKYLNGHNNENRTNWLRDADWNPDGLYTKIEVEDLMKYHINNLKYNISSWQTELRKLERAQKLHKKEIERKKQRFKNAFRNSN